MYAYAAGNTIEAGYIDSIIKAVQGWVTSLAPLLIGLTVVALFYGLFKYVWGGADEKSNGKTIMIWGVIALTVMISVWGLVGLLQEVAGINTATTSVTAPTLP